MRKHATVVLLASTLSTVAGCAAQEDPPVKPAPQAPAKARYTLPPDPTAVVLVLDYQDGYTPPREDEAPWFEIRADGSMVVRDVFRLSDRPKMEGRLSPEELQDLLRFVIAEQELTAWDEAAVRRALAAYEHGGGTVLYVEDAATTVVTLRLPDHAAEAKFNALGVIAPTVPKIAPLQRLLAVEQRLQHLAAVIVAGGAAQVEALCAAANEALAEKHADQKPFAPAELSSAHRSATGALTAMFLRALPAEAGKRRQLWASVNVDEEGRMSADVQVTELP